MNPLDQYPGVRKALYIFQWVVNLALGVLGVVFTAQGLSPQWFVIVGLVFNFIWSYTGITAAANVTPNTTAAEGDPINGHDGLNIDINNRDEHGEYSNWASIIVLVLVVLIFLAVFGVIHR